MASNIKPMTSPELSQQVADNDAWRSWIAENLMLGASAESLEAAMVQAGVAQGHASFEIKKAMASPYLAGAQRLRNRLAKRDWVLDIQRKMGRLGSAEIERKERPSEREFLEGHYRRSEPVIITGALDHWPAMSKWSEAYFKERFGQQQVEVQFGRNADPDYEINSVKHKRAMSMASYVDLIDSSSPTNDFYMTANNASSNRGWLKELFKDAPGIPEYLNDDVESGFFWFGPEGTLTPFHHDLTNNFMAQVVGRKRVLIIPACEIARMPNPFHCFTPVDGRAVDIERYPSLADVRIQACVLEPGETLFLPVGCWHFVESLDVSVTISFTNFKWDNDFYSNYPAPGFQTF